MLNSLNSTTQKLDKDLNLLSKLTVECKDNKTSLVCLLPERPFTSIKYFHLTTCTDAQNNKVYKYIYNLKSLYLIFITYFNLEPNHTRIKLEPNPTNHSQNLNLNPTSPICGALLHRKDLDKTTGTHKDNTIIR